MFTVCCIFSREQHEKISTYNELLWRKNELEFFCFTRVTKKTFMQLGDKMESSIDQFSPIRGPTQGPTPTPASTALAATLWYLGNLTSQREIAERFNISQGHLSHLVKVVVDFLCSMSKDVIHWPTEGEIVQTEVDFKAMANFPGVVGAIDGCQIPILAPEYCQQDYLNRNHCHSVNLMAVCDSSARFTFCYAGFPGSAHDQRVFANSSLGLALDASPKRYFPSNYYHVIRDSAFQLHEHVMVPYKDTGSLTVTEQTFNTQLSQTRRIIENAFGLLKGRFRRLRRLECKMSSVPTNIIACCILHNLTICDECERDMLLSDMTDSQQDSCVSDSAVCSVTSASPVAAKKKRDDIAKSSVNVS